MYRGDDGEHDEIYPTPSLCRRPITLRHRVVKSSGTRRSMSCDEQLDVMMSTAEKTNGYGAHGYEMYHR